MGSVVRHLLRILNLSRYWKNIENMYEMNNLCKLNTKTSEFLSGWALKDWVLQEIFIVCNISELLEWKR